MRRKVLPRLAFLWAMCVPAICAFPALADDLPRSGEGGESLPPGRVEEINTYGTVSPTAVWIPAAAFHPHNSSVTWARVTAGGGAIARTAGGLSDQFWAEVNLPNGAVVNRVEIHHFDNSPTDTGFFCFTRYNVDGGFNLQESCLSFPDGIPGASTLGFVPSATIRVIDNRHPHVVHVYVDGNNPTYHFWGVRIVYALSISPSPLVATFPNDVPTTHTFFRFVEALAAAGITGGCAPSSYCPDQPVTRGQMAVFLAAALGLHFADAAIVP
jgi:hypothetical protein